MPEIADAFERDGQYFGVVGIQLAGTSRQFQFGVSHAGYRALKRVLQLRPFDSMPGLKQKYYFASHSMTAGSSDYTAHVRVEQNRESKQIGVRVPKDLLSNLIWFSQIKDFAEAAHLTPMS